MQGLAFVCSDSKGFAVNQEWQRGFIMVKVPFEDSHSGLPAIPFPPCLKPTGPQVLLLRYLLTKCG